LKLQTSSFKPQKTFKLQASKPSIGGAFSHHHRGGARRLRRFSVLSGWESYNDPAQLSIRALKRRERRALSPRRSLVLSGGINGHPSFGRWLKFDAWSLFEVWSLDFEVSSFMIHS